MLNSLRQIPDLWLALICIILLVSNGCSTFNPLCINHLLENLVIWKREQGKLGAWEQHCLHFNWGKYRQSSSGYNKPRSYMQGFLYHFVMKTVICRAKTRPFGRDASK